MPPRTEIQNEKIREETKEKILNCAIKLFSTKGFHATSINDIANLANISVGLTYRYFKSKQELYESIIEFSISGISEIINIFESDLPVLDIFTIVSTTLLNELDNEDYVSLSVMMISNLISNANPYTKKVLENNNKMFNIAAKRIKDGQEIGVFKKGNPNQLAQLYFSVISGITQTRFFLKDGFIKPSQEQLLSILI